VKEERFQPGTFVNALRITARAPLDHDTIYARYEEILTWLWRILQPSDKSLLYTVSLFDPENGATEPDIAAVFDQIGIELRGLRLAELCRLSLLSVQQHPNLPKRYTLHAIVYHFVRGKAAELGAQKANIEEVEQAYINHHIRLTHQYARDFPTLDIRRANILNMFDLIFEPAQPEALRCEAITALCMVYPYLERRGLYAAAVALIERALRLPELAAMPTEHIQLLHRAGQAEFKRSNFKVSKDYLTDALTLAQATDLTDFNAEIYIDLGLIELQQSNFTDAVDQFEAAHQFAQQHHHLIALARISGNNGVIYIRQGLYEEAVPRYRQAWDYIGDMDQDNLPHEIRDVLLVCHTGLGIAALEASDYAQAEAGFQEAMRIARAVNNPERIGNMYINLGVVAYFRGEPATAEEYFLQARIIADYIQQDDLTALALLNLGALAAARWQYERAEELLLRALMIAEDLKLRWLQTGVYITLGESYFAQNVYPKAEQCFLSALDCAGTNPKWRAQALYGLALTAIVEQDIAGKRDPARAADQIRRMLTRHNIEPGRLQHIKKERWTRTARVFQHDLNRRPDLDRYCIIEGFEALF
jgi:tetratricopeptide (TPR) repeat protein